MSPAARIVEAMAQSLYDDPAITEPPDGSVIVRGIVHTFAMDPQKLEKQRETVTNVIKEVVSDAFFVGKGGGWSSLNLCLDRQGDQWCERPTMEALCVLSIGLGLAKWCLPRDLWPVLPGGMPYIQFNSLEGV